MFNVEEFNSYIKEHYNKSIIFIFNERIQAIINDSPICSCENIEKLVIKIMDDEFFVETLVGIPNYEQSYVLFTKTFIKYSYNRFNYFFCTLTTTGTRVVVIFPLKFEKEFYKKLIKINELKAFL